MWKSGQGIYRVRKCFAGSAEIYRMIAQLKDEALPAIYHVEEEDGVVRVEMEYIEGLTLTDILTMEFMGVLLVLAFISWCVG